MNSLVVALANSKRRICRRRLAALHDSSWKGVEAALKKAERIAATNPWVARA